MKRYEEWGIEQVVLLTSGEKFLCEKERDNLKAHFQIISFLLQLLTLGKIIYSISM